MKQILKRAPGFTALSLLMPCVLLGLQTGCKTPQSTAAQRQPIQETCKTQPPTAAQLQPLQGTWEETKAGDAGDGKVTVTIYGNSLHFHRDSNFWFKTTFILPAGTDPQQLHATINESAPPGDSNGQVVNAIFKIEDGTLTLAAEPREGSKAFEEPSTFHYKLRKAGELGTFGPQLNISM